jgi:hypothetical protein
MPYSLRFGLAKGAGFDFSSLDHSTNPSRMLAGGSTKVFREYLWLPGAPPDRKLS